MNGADSTLPIRPGMDVFSTYQDQYIGAVVSVRHGTMSSGRGPTSAGGRNPTGSEQPAQPAPMVHEEGAVSNSTEHGGKHTLGEEMGPVPTMAAGNSGPERQSAAEAYATDPDSHFQGIVSFTVRPGRLNLGPLSRPLHVPASAVRAVSMERVVLEIQREDIPVDWRRTPDK